MRNDTITPPTRRPVPATSSPVRQQGLFLLLWSLRHHVAHPRLAASVVFLVWGAVFLLLCAHVMPSQAAAPAAHRQPTPTPVLSVASRVPALYQGDPSIGWDNREQFDTWWPSACSAVALTAGLRAWGIPAPVGTVLDRLWAHGAITADQGLLHPEALATVAEEYGLHAQTFRSWSQMQVQQVTSQGVPVLVDLHDAQQQTPYPGFVVGHWLVVVSVSAQQIAVRDSSGYHIHTFTPALFHTLFTGVAVVVWQRALSLPKEG